MKIKLKALGTLPSQVNAEPFRVCPWRSLREHRQAAGTQRGGNISFAVYGPREPHTVGGLQNGSFELGLDVGEGWGWEGGQEALSEPGGEVGKARQGLVRVE